MADAGTHDAVHDEQNEAHAKAAEESDAHQLLALVLIGVGGDGTAFNDFSRAQRQVAPFKAHLFQHLAAFIEKLAGLGAFFFEEGEVDAATVEAFGFLRIGGAALLQAAEVVLHFFGRLTIDLHVIITRVGLGE